MKKLILAALVLMSSNAWARIEVPVAWPFTLGGPSANNLREVIAQANESQTKYQFIFLHRPGAGGSVAAKHVEKSDQLSILAHTPSFFVNPHLTKEKVYSEDQFSMINVYCDDVPIAIMSKKYQSINEMPKNTDISVGLGPGLMDIVFQNLKSQTNLKLFSVPHNSTEQLVVNLLGGHIDNIVSWTSTSKNNGFHVLGITGKIHRDGFSTFESQGIKNLSNIYQSFYFFVKSDTPEDVKKELSQILAKAAVAPRSTEFCAIDHGRSKDVTYPNTNAIMAEKSKYWKQKVDDYQKLISGTK